MSNKTNRVLALHGFTGCGEDFAGFSPLCHSVETWHCPDLPGHGPAPALDCTPEATGRFLSKEAGDSNILLGYSMGARAALLHATENPRRWDCLILISPNPGLEDTSERIARAAEDDKLAQRIERDGVSRFIDYWQATPMIQSQANIRADWLERMRACRSQHSAAGLASSLREFGQGRFPNLWPRLSTLQMPVLLLTGAGDTKYTAISSRMADLHDFAHYTVEGAGHMPHLEQPERASVLIDEFCSKNASK